MNEEMLKRLQDIRTSLQSLISDFKDKYGDDNEGANALDEADGNLSEAEDWSEEE